jgi:hypothetical protein
MIKTHWTAQQGGGLHVASATLEGRDLSEGQASSGDAASRKARARLASGNSGACIHR